MADTRIEIAERFEAAGVWLDVKLTVRLLDGHRAYDPARFVAAWSALRDELAACVLPDVEVE